MQKILYSLSERRYNITAMHYSLIIKRTPWTGDKAHTTHWWIVECGVWLVDGVAFLQFVCYWPDDVSLFTNSTGTLCGVAGQLEGTAGKLRER